MDPTAGLPPPRQTARETMNLGVEVGAPYKQEEREDSSEIKASLAGQWLRLHASTIWGVGLILLGS